MSGHLVSLASILCIRCIALHGSASSGLALLGIRSKRRTYVDHLPWASSDTSSGATHGASDKNPACCVACHVGAEIGILDAQPQPGGDFQRLDTVFHASTRVTLGWELEVVKCCGK